jgi:hypothetical protein
VVTLFAQSKQVVTTLLMTFMRCLVSWMTLSTLLKVAARPTVGSFTVNCSCCTYVGTLSRCSRSSFFVVPAGTCNWIITRLLITMSKGSNNNNWEYLKKCQLILPDMKIVELSCTVCSLPQRSILLV